jgi:hypothetical protein
VRGFHYLIALVVYLTGCTPQTSPSQQQAQPVTPTPAPEVTNSHPVVPVVKPPTAHIRVPANATDPVLVREGVSEWLNAHSAEFKPAHREAILRRMKIESGFQPCVTNGRYHYLLQWADERLHNLWTNAGVRPGHCPSWISQLRHMEWELNHYTQYAVFLRKPSYYTFTVDYLGGRL